MTDHDAALRFDAMLDNGPSADPATDPLLATAARLRELDLHQRAIPSDAFREQLRRSLHASPNGTHPLSAPDRPIPLPPSRPAVRRATQPKHSHRLLAVAAALLLLLGGAGAITRFPIGTQHDPEPSAIPAASFSSPATPDDATAPADTTQVASSGDAEISWVSPKPDNVSFYVPEYATTDRSVFQVFGTADGDWQIRSVDTDTGNVRWTQVLGITTGVLAGYDDLLLVAGYDRSLDEPGPVLLALASDSGEEIWRIPLSNEAPADMLVHGARAFVLGNQNVLDTVDLSAGKLVVSTDLSSDATPWDVVEAPSSSVMGARLLAITGGTLAAVLADGSVTGVDIESGEIAWQKLRPESGITQVIATDGRFLIVDDGTASQISADFQANNNQLVSQATPATSVATCLDKVVSTSTEPTFDTPEDAARKTVVLGIDPESGATDWTVESRISYMDQILSDRSVVFASYSSDIWPLDPSDIALCTIDAATGSVWQAASVSDIAEQTALVVVEDTVLLKRVIGVLGGGSFLNLDAALDPTVVEPRAVFDPSLSIMYMWVESVEGGLLLARDDGQLIRISWQDQSPVTPVSETPVPERAPSVGTLDTDIPLIVENGIVYSFRAFEDFTGLVAERTSDSSRLWDVAGTATGELAVDDDAAYVAFAPTGSGQGKVDAYAAKSGKALWSWTAGGSVTGLAVADGVVYAVTTDGALTALDAASGQVQWTTALGSGSDWNATVWGYETIAVSGDSVAALTPSGTFAVVDRANGMVRWNRDGYDPSVTAFAVTADSVVLVDKREFATREEAKDLPDDAIVVNKPSDGVIVAQAPGTVLPDGSMALAPVVGWSVAGFDLASGDTLWQDGFPSVLTPPVAIGEIVAISAEMRDPGGDRSSIVGIAARTGEMTMQPGQPIVQLGTWSPSDDAPELFVTVSDTGLLSLVAPSHLGAPADATTQPDVHDGAVVDLNSGPDRDVSVMSQPVGDDSGIWLMTDSNQLGNIHPDLLNHAFGDQMATARAESGAAGVAWFLAPPQDVPLPASSLLAVDADTVYQTFGGTDGTSIVRAIDSQSGSVRWERSVDSWIVDLTVHDGMVLIAGSFGTAAEESYSLIALDEETGKAIWRIGLDQLPVGVFVVDDTIIVLGRGNQLDRYDLATQELVWSANLDEAPGVAQITVSDFYLDTKGRLAVTDNLIGAVIDTGQVVTVDIATGEPVWVSSRTNDGWTEIQTVGNRFVVTSYGGRSPSNAATPVVDATPLAEPMSESNACQQTFSVDPDAALPAGSLAEGFDPKTGESLWALGSIDGSFGWPVNDSTLLALAPSEVEATSGADEIYCLVDVATGTITQADGGVPGSPTMFRMIDPQHPTQEQVFAVPVDGYPQLVELDPSTASSLPLFDMNIADYGGGFNAQVTDGAILIMTIDGTLFKLNDPGQ